MEPLLVAGQVVKTIGHHPQQIVVKWKPCAGVPPVVVDSQWSVEEAVGAHVVMYTVKRDLHRVRAYQVVGDSAEQSNGWRVEDAGLYEVRWSLADDTKDYTDGLAFLGSKQDPEGRPGEFAAIQKDDGVLSAVAEVVVIVLSHHLLAMSSESHLALAERHLDCKPRAAVDNDHYVSKNSEYSKPDFGFGFGFGDSL